MASVSLLTQAMKVFIAQTVYSAKKAKDAVIKNQKLHLDINAVKVDDILKKKY